MFHVKNSLIAIAALLIAALTSISANASFLIEPHVGYIVSGGIDSYGGYKYEYNDVQYGARLGIQHLGIMGGFAYTHAELSNNYTLLSGARTTGISKEKADDIGVFVGYSAPLMLRAWVSYFFSSKNADATHTSIYTKGSTTEIGLGFTPMPLISINASYRMVSHNKTNTGATLSTKYEPKEIVLGVSLPITLL